MQFKQSLLLTLISTSAAQNASSLTDALGSENSTLSSLNTLLQQNPQFLQSIGNAQNVTFLAPNNDALNAIMSNTNSSSPNSSSPISSPADIDALLRYHVLNGTYYASDIGNTSQFIPTRLTNTSYTNVTGGQRVECVSDGNNNVTFISALRQNVSAVTNNINFTGGTIYIVDGILSVPQNVTDTLSNANLTACVGALAATNQTQNLTDGRNVTIFAPNNDAFNAVGNVLANQTTDQLSNILGYHVVNGTLAYSTDLQNGTLRAANGQDLNISVINNETFVNSARLTVPDILYSNGVIHVIDQVLNPNNTSATPDMSATSATPAYTGASSGTGGIPFTSGVTTPTTTYPAATSAGGQTAEGVAMPMKTGAVGAAALFGGAAMLANF
ncbi:FAS1 domain-containing protein [Xylaria grammica]|nr:FAS1 domain-containing protein [Xylaria grammica]